MLRYRLIHPEILGALAAAGHGSRVLLADGHYPVSTGAAAGVPRVWLNLAPNRLTVVEVLEVLVDAVVVEAAAVMQPAADQPEPEVFGEFAELLGDCPVERLDRFAFYDAARSPDLALVIATGELRTYANLLLTLGVAS
ncbi:MAG: RbsD or FucU transport [Nitriliruptorales bacterium]|nr:RbsD or FucU transport [Nitriliruptorales bacterium]